MTKTAMLVHPFYKGAHISRDKIKTYKDIIDKYDKIFIYVPYMNYTKHIVYS